ncbi:heme peroxidase [Lentithecium fluviatile CBS 122367]|uniref:linoleate 8R-lipoxygenase n=1 Tax=Lentithecium fluviatile CBS 122367 TaxID=1168545 RepID=A0A6G1IJD2_9PLEO|nr:heme peroxidase [Lentithecium fluviatile CBS 122367]
MPNLNPFKDDSKPNDPKDVLIRSLIRDVKSQLTLERIDSNGELLKGLSDFVATGGALDDKKYVAENLLKALTSLPEGSQTGEFGTGILLKYLWDNLRHPPLSCMGDPYKYRTADGCNNNIMFPHIGKSGSFYARSVTPQHVPTRLPDPGVMFDALLARDGAPKPHPNKISSMMFAMATLIIHDVFRTSDQDQNVVDVSSYLDLSPLYGANQDAQDSVRTFKDGKLKPDTFAEVRLLGQPPESPVLLICFNRYHNYIAEQLAIINEADRFSLPPGIKEADTESYDKAVGKRDNDLFQVARLVTGGLYFNIITNDYFRTILNLHRTDSEWNLNPRKDYPEIFGQGNLEEGIGNQVSVEFNLIYRWHSVISSRNERFLNDFFHELFPDTKVEDLTQAQFRAGMRSWATNLPIDPGQRSFGGLERGSEGHFNDSDLVNILTEATEDVAGVFGARHVPVALKPVEVLAIQQARRWGVATLNELRRHFGMLPHKTFASINSDPDVAASLEALYGDVDNVELYPGVVVEEAKIPMIPGSGLCAGFTTTRAILSDAVTLTRGDRFYTLDYTPVHLTAFGYNEVSNDKSIAGGGYRGNSIYAFYPFTVPNEMRKIKQSLGQEVDYDYGRPQLESRPVFVTTWKGVDSVLLYSRSYEVSWGKNLGLLSEHEFMLGADTPAATEQRKYVGRAIFSPEKSMIEFAHCIEFVTTDLVHKRSHKLRDIYELDAVKDIAALSWTQFAALLFHIPLKGSKHPDAALDDWKLYDLLSVIFELSFLDTDPTKSFAIRKRALKAYTELLNVVKPVCEAAKCQSIGHLMRYFKSDNHKLLPSHGTKLLERLFEGGKSVEEVTSWVISLMAGLVIPSAKALSQILNIFLQEPYHSQHWPEIQNFASNTSPAAVEKLRKYALEGLRLTTPLSAIVRIAHLDATLVDGATTHSVKKGDTLVLDIAKASRDPDNFPDPDDIDLDRPEESYIHFGKGMHTCLGRSIAVAGLVEQLRIFGKMKGLRRAPGNQRRLRSRRVGAVTMFLSDGADAWNPLPTSMKLHVDACGEGKVS